MTMVWVGPPFEERFWARVEKTDTCWHWTGGASKPGYGTAWYEKRQQPAHRVAYELLVGPIPEGLEIDHLCRNPSCVNPDHLEPVTHAENMRRASFVKLTPEAVREIRSLWDRPGRELARLYGVSDTTISRVRSNELWNHWTLEDACATAESSASADSAPGLGAPSGGPGASTSRSDG